MGQKLFKLLISFTVKTVTPRESYLKKEVKCEILHKHIILNKPKYENMEGS